MNITKPQKLIYNMEKVAGESIAIICGSVFICTDNSVDDLKKGVNELYRLNDALRIRVFEENGQPCQFIAEYAQQEIEVLCFDCKQAFDDYASIYAKEPIDFYGSLCDIKVVVLPDKKGIIAKLHHFISDAWTLSLIGTQFIKILNKEEVQAYSYADYILAEEKYVKSKRYAKDKEYFISQFKKCTEATYISEKQSHSFESNRATFIIDKEKTSKIVSYTKQKKISVFTLFMSAVATYIYRVKMDAERFFIGTSVINRNGAKEQNTLGMFINTAPVLIEINNEASFFENLNEIESAAFSVFRHQKYNYNDLMEELRKTHGNDGKLYDVMLSYHNAIVLGDGFESAWHHSGMQTESLQIHIDDHDSEGIFRMHYDYLVEKFTEHEIEKLHEHICNLLFSAIADDSKKLYELNILSQEEKENLLFTFNNSVVDYPRDKCVHELFEEQAARTPDKTAVVAVDKTLTYKELNEEANRIAHSLMEKGVVRGDIVGLMLPRKSSFLSALFGILKTGAAYLPVDGDFPEDRIKHILSDSNAKLCISENNIAPLMRNEKIHNPQQQTQPTDICYCIFTSGSTGLSKGTKIYHRNLTWYISVLKQLYGSENINMPFFTSQCVDLTVPSFYFPLLTGGATYLYNEDLKDCLIDIFSNENLTIIKFTPTHINITNKLVPDKLCPNLRYIIVGGETLYTAACFEFLNKFGKHIEIHNEYGPTETTVSCTDYIFRAEETESYLSIGKPIANAQIYITDQYLNPVPIGVTGEICIAGDGVGAGYLNRPELTAEKFIDNPFGEGKLYRTGDLAYWREDGNIVFVGRNDFQVKIRGLRIELGEIEKAITAVDGIVSGVVVVRKDKTDRQLICAFYTGEEKSAKELRAVIGKHLPKYMIPHIFMHLENMPMTTSGKINRNALPELDLENITTETEYVVPKTQEEKALADAISSILTKNAIGMFDNFFAIGGDSIKAIYIVSALEEKGYELRVADIMQSDTLADIAKSMKATSDKAIYNQSEVIGVIPFSPIMRAFLHERNTIPKDFVHFCIIATDCDEATARKAFDALISHHDMLRGSFVANGIEIHSSAENDIYSFKAICIEDTQKAKEYLNDVIIDDDKLVHVVFCETENENLIRIIVHHFLIDLVSWEVMMEDFKTAVNQIKNKEVISLPAKTASFKQWSEELWEYAEAIPEANKEYWKKINEALDHVSSFGANEENEVEKYSFEFDESFTDKLINAANKTYGTRTNEILLTALGGAASKVVDGTVGIIVETHGRTEFNNPLTIGRTIGWFTSGYPIVFNNNNNEHDALINIKETMRRMPKNGIEYLLLADGFHKNAGIKFNFYQNSRTVQNRGNDLIAFGSGTSVFPGKINVDCVVANNILSVNIFAPKGENKKYLCEELGQEFKKQIEKIVAICTATNTVIKTRSDFSDDTLTESELDELKELFDWTDN